jgi:hypothetical protein
VIERTLRTTPADATHWSIRSMAAETGFSHTTIRRMWAAFGSRTVARHSRQACGFGLANKGHDTRALQTLSRLQEHPTHRQVYGAIAHAVQGFLAALNCGRLIAAVPSP